jgi:magnesium transporter
MPEVKKPDTSLSGTRDDAEDSRTVAGLEPEGINGSEHPADAADRIENLSVKEQVRAVERMDLTGAAETLAEMEKYDRTKLMKRLKPRLAASIVATMAPDDAVDILDELGDDHKEALLKWFDEEDAAEIERLLSFDPESAGGVMNPDIVVLDEKLTADQAVQFIRREVEDKEIPYYAYLVDDFEHLVGVLSMRDLLLSPPGRMLGDLIRDQALVAVTFDVDREEVAQLISHYNFLALPVVDYENRLLGVVTVDDVIDIIHQEATEDMQTMVGAASDETMDSPWTYSVVKRLPWLVLNVVNSAVSAWVVHLFEGTIAQMAFLAVLMPIVANQAGNTGQQALAVMIRQLAVEKFDRRRSWRAVLRECKIGLINGVVISSLVLTSVLLITENLVLALVTALALGLDMLVGSLAGASIPLVLRALGRDPAQASSIFLTTLTDSFGFLCLLGFAGLVLL